MGWIRRGIRYAASYGIGYTLRRVREKAEERVLHRWDRAWRGEFAPDEEELAAQRGRQPDAGLISVVIPVYNTDPGLLTALTDSLYAQTFLNWEACLYSAGDSAETEAALAAAAAADKRIRVQRAEVNEGIAGNTNRAIAMARGGWIVLCDHDDLLPPNALWLLAQEIERGEADVIYTDEDRITEDGRRHTDPHLKPDFCPDNLMSGNYICHLLAARRELIEAVGGERPDFDGSQDHDLALRLSEATRRIAHIPRICYHWRIVKSSMSHRHLDRCLDAACRAAEEHMRRTGWPGTARAEHGVIRLRYELKPLSGAAIVFGEDPVETERCLQALWKALPKGVQVRSVRPGAGESLYAAVNRAAEASKEDLLLFVHASVSRFGEGFWEELAMYAQRGDVGLVTPQLTDARGRITHAGFAAGVKLGLQCRNQGLPGRAAGYFLLNRQSHNVCAVSPACFMVRRAAWLPLDPGYHTGFAAADLCLRMAKQGLVHVYTPHAAAVCVREDLLLLGPKRDSEDRLRFNQSWGGQADPCRSPLLSEETADFMTWRNET